MGHIAGQLNLGYFYDEGLFVRKDKKKAIEWYYKAYRQGDPCGANNIAAVYRDLGCETKMLWWRRRAAAMGDPDMLLELGDRCQRGLRASKSLAKARMFYRKVILSAYSSEEDKAVAAGRLRALATEPGDRRV